MSKQKLTLYLFSLSVFLALLIQSSSSKAADCQWASLTGFGDVITESCQMVSQGSTTLLWNTVTYHCAPTGFATLNFTDDVITIPPNATKHSNHSVNWSKLPSGTYDCVAFGGNQNGSWSASTGDTYITL